MSIKHVTVNYCMKKGKRKSSSIYLSRIKVLLLLLALIIGLFVWFAIKISREDEAEARTKFSQTEIIVKYKSSATEERREGISRKHGTKRGKKLGRLNAEVVTVPYGNVSKFISLFKDEKEIEYVEPNAVVKGLSVPNDPELTRQWNLYKIMSVNATSQSAWDMSNGNTPVKVAVLDTGINESHPELFGKITDTANFTTSSSSADVHGHGTHVAGIIAASTNNSSGVASVGFSQNLMNGKVLDDAGSGYYSWVAQGIIWAADNGAKVINLSLGADVASLTLESAVNYATDKGVVVVAAAGNNGTTTPFYPAYYDKVIAVGATDQDDNKPTWSSYGSWVDVAAPGSSIYSTYKTSYIEKSGTSMASPHVAGEAALLYGTICATNTCVREKIESSTDTIAGSGTYWAKGRINVFKAMGGGTSEPVVTPTPTLSPATPTPTVVSPTVTPIPGLNLTVSDITMWFEVVSTSSRRIYTKVKVVDKNTGSPITTAKVYLTITAPSGRAYKMYQYTNTSGEFTARISSKEKGIFKSQITSVVKKGYKYIPTVTSKTLEVN